jgi:hypothetical protein
VAVIPTFAEAHRVVEEAEKDDEQWIGANLSGQIQSVGRHAPPMTLAVKGRDARRRGDANGIEHRREVGVRFH